MTLKVGNPFVRVINEGITCDGTATLFSSRLWRVLWGGGGSRFIYRVTINYRMSLLVFLEENTNVQGSLHLTKLQLQIRVGVN